MTKSCDWSSFYDTLCHHGPNLLLGIDDDLREMIMVAGSSTDMFWSEGLQELLKEGAAEGALITRVLSALERWRENVLETLEMDFGIELDWQSVSIDAENPLIDELIKAAFPGE